MEEIAADDRKIYTCFTLTRVPCFADIGMRCDICKNNVLLGYVFCYHHSISQLKSQDKPLLDLWGGRHGVTRSWPLVVCSYCFLPKVELYEFPGESEKQQFKKCIMDGGMVDRFHSNPAFKIRLQLNKSKSARKLAD
jgi:hypothetical protein